MNEDFKNTCGTSESSFIPDYSLPIHEIYYVGDSAKLIITDFMQYDGCNDLNYTYTSDYPDINFLIFDRRTGGFLLRVFEEN